MNKLIVKILCSYQVNNFRYWNSYYLLNHKREIDLCKGIILFNEKPTIRHTYMYINIYLYIRKWWHGKIKLIKLCKLFPFQFSFSSHSIIQLGLVTVIILYIKCGIKNKTWWPPLFLWKKNMPRVEIE